MKKVVSQVLVALIFFYFSFYPLASYSKVDLSDELNSLRSEKFNSLRNNLKKICSSKVFFKNLKNHKSYPFFGTVSNWKKKCGFLQESSVEIFKNFFLNNFEFVTLKNKPGLLTGYYEPTINVSETKNNIYKYPILKKKKKFANKPRATIEKNYKIEDVVLWTDSKIDLFFLHIQGSGLGKFPNNQIIKIKYNGNNNLPYTSIGKYLKKKKYLKNSNINLFSIKNWLIRNPSKSQDILNLNKRFVFFKTEKINLEDYAVGAVGLPLTPNESIAVDKNIYPLGLPFIIKYANQNIIKPALSLDTGSAIIGSNRADLFTGRGKIAEETAGTLKKKIYLYSVIPYDK